jgi:hypothetical protein
MEYLGLLLIAAGLVWYFVEVSCSRPYRTMNELPSTATSLSRPPPPK